MIWCLLVLLVSGFASCCGVLLYWHVVALIWLDLLLWLWLGCLFAAVLMAFFAALTVGVSVNSVVHWYL